MRTGDKSWRQITVPSKSMEPIKVFINVDKSDKSKKTEQLAKKLSKAVRAAVPNNEQIQFTKKDGAVFSEWEPLGKVRVDTKEEHAILFNNPVLEKYKLDKQAILGSFKTSSRSVTGVMWCP